MIIILSMKHDMSRPARGAWIETVPLYCFAPTASGRVPRGARGLKQAVHCSHPDSASRVPRGARGLKPPSGNMSAAE